MIQQLLDEARPAADVFIKQPPKAEKYTYVGLILDESGSMHGLQADVVGGINGQLAEIKKDAKLGGTTYVSLMKFHSVVTPVYWNKRPSTLAKIDPESYRPSGGTALYDALGRMLSFMESVPNADGEDTAFYIKVFTDGEENESREITGKALAKLIKRLNKTGRWTIDFVGANLDLKAMSETFGLKLGNTLVWNPTHAGTQSMNTASIGSTHTYFSARGMGRTATEELYTSVPVTVTTGTGLPLNTGTGAENDTP